MKSTFSGILLAMGAALSISAVAAQSTLPKEGDVVCSGVFHVMSNNVSMGEDVSQYSYQAVGGLLTEKEETLLDRMSGRCVGSGRVVKGTLEAETGMCEFIDLTGDKLTTTTSSTKGDAAQSTLSQAEQASIRALPADGLASDTHCGLPLRDRRLWWSPTRGATNCHSAPAYWTRLRVLACHNRRYRRAEDLCYRCPLCGDLAHLRSTAIGQQRPSLPLGRGASSTAPSKRSATRASPT